MVTSTLPLRKGKGAGEISSFCKLGALGWHVRGAFPDNASDFRCECLRKVSPCFAQPTPIPSRQPRRPRWPQGWSNLRHSQPKGHQGARVRTEFSRDSRSPPRLFTANVKDKERISTFFLPSWSPATSQEETTVREFVAPWHLLPALLELDFSSPAQQTRPDHCPPSSRPPLASHRHQHP